MSLKMMVRIMEEVDVPRPQATILLAMAENAHDDGSSCFPSLDLIAWKAGYTRSAVKKIVRDLRLCGVLEVVSPASGHRPAEYAIHLEVAPRKPSFQEWQGVNGRTPRGSKTDPLNTEEGVILGTPEGQRVDPLGVNLGSTGGQQLGTPEPSLTVTEPSEEPGRDARDDSSPPAPPAPKASPPTRMSDNFAVTEVMRSWAIDLGLGAHLVDFETEKFVDHFRANGEARADWVAGWRNWIRRELGYQQRDAAKGQGRAGPVNAARAPDDSGPKTQEQATAGLRAYYERRVAKGDLRAANGLSRLDAKGEDPG